MTPAAPIQLGELCRRLDVPYRHARYILEQGFVPEGVDPEPDRGNHRHLTVGQAMWLAIVLKLKESAVKAPLAARIADFTKRMVTSTSQNGGWDPRFAPFHGLLETESRWFVDIGDLKYVRVVTDSHPSRDGLYEFPWSYVDRVATADDAEPTIVIRLDISRIARLLRS